MTAMALALEVERDGGVKRCCNGDYERHGWRRSVSRRRSVIGSSDEKWRGQRCSALCPLSGNENDDDKLNGRWRSASCPRHRCRDCDDKYGWGMRDVVTGRGRLENHTIFTRIITYKFISKNTWLQFATIYVFQTIFHQMCWAWEVFCKSDITEGRTDRQINMGWAG